MAKGKAALGRGLGALLPNTESEDTPSPVETAHRKLYDFQERGGQVGRVADVPLDRIEANPYQPRQEFDETALRELAASIASLGVIQPITVRASDEGRYQIISGERRVRAARLSGLESIPAYVREADSEAMLEMAIVENVQREELNPIEVALGYQRLVEECELTQEEVADKVGKNRTTVANFVRLLKLPPEVQAGLRDGSLSAGHARALIPLDDADAQIDVMRAIVKDGLSVRAVEKLIRSLSKPPAIPAPAVSDPLLDRTEALLIQSLTDRLRANLSTKVRIVPGGERGGRIEVQYYSDEDLERLIELMGS